VKEGLAEGLEGWGGISYRPHPVGEHLTVDDGCLGLGFCYRPHPVGEHLTVGNGCLRLGFCYRPHPVLRTPLLLRGGEWLRGVAQPLIYGE